MGIERRLAPRFSFIAGGEMSDRRTDTRLSMRVSEISRSGCYVDMMNPLPNGTPVRLTIAAGGALFQADAKVVYSVEHMGAGILFEEIDSTNGPILDRWLAEAEGKAAQ